MKRKHIWLITAGTFLLFAILAAVGGIVLHPKGWGLGLLVGGLLVLGAVAAVLVYLYLRGPKATASAPGDEEVDAAIAAARGRLAGAGKLGKLPAVLVLGPEGSAKTTVVSQSGLAPELVAGETERAGTVVPTTGLNVWFARSTVFVEAAGRLLLEPTRWARVIRHLQPQRLGAAFARGEQAPRIALVCYACDEFLKPGASDSVLAAARTLRERLLELSQGLGIRLPVYVMFTKADRLPYFGDFVRSLSTQEAQEALGATLPAPPAAWAEAQAQEPARVQSAFQGLFRSLALRRIDVLPREIQEDVRAGAYEFPREFRKASELASQFLVELCRPSHLGISPFLRGFYFTGVRAVVVDDGGAAAVPQAPTPSAPAGMAATGVFDARMLQGMAAAASAPRGPRRVPEWTFLPHVFGDVLLSDRAAMGATSGGTRVNGLRRAALAAAALVFVVLGAGFTTSWVNNRRMERWATEAAQATKEAPDQAGARSASLDALQKLDVLRGRAAELRRYEQQGRPWRLGWGLYTGDAQLPELRRLYFERFGTLLWQPTQQALMAKLGSLPATPDATSEYGPIYDALKAHLITTDHPEKSTAVFLGPELLALWAEGAQPDSARRELALRQFSYFGAELPFGNPFQERSNAALVASTRTFLKTFGNAERLYQALVAEASEVARPVQFNHDYPGTATAVKNDVVIPGAFTRQGWSYVQAKLKNVDQLLNREPWVLGEGAVAPEERTKLASELKDRYVADYVKHWEGYLSGASVATSSDPATAAGILARLSGNQSPLLQMLSVASQNTAVDTTVVSKAFQPVEVVMPSSATDKFVVDANAPYVQALAGLGQVMQQAAAAQGPAAQLASTQAATASDQVNGAVQQLSAKFLVQGEAGEVGKQVQRLLRAPASGATAVVAALPAAGANANGASFCRQIGGLLGKYPFNPRGADATVDEVTAVFGRSNSALTGFYDGVLQPIVSLQGTRYAAKVGAVPQPTSSFLEFFNQAMEVSRALYDAGSTSPEVVFTIRPQTSETVPEVTVSIGGVSHTFTRAVAASYTYSWDGARPGDAQITAKVGGQDLPVAQAPAGVWAPFRLFQQGTWDRLPGGSYAVTWKIPGQGGTLTTQVNFNKGIAVFRPGYLSGLNCVSRIAR